MSPMSTVYATVGLFFTGSLGAFSLKASQPGAFAAPACVSSCL
jgi:hypothetical protein